MYSPFDFGRMLAHPRVAAYTRALERFVTPGSVVVDIGTGTGYFAMVAARLGARKVYAIETIRQAARLAKTTVADNGLSDVIEVIEGFSTEVTLPELADVVVADLRGRIPIFGSNVASLHDAKVRLTKPTGVIVPLRDQVQIALFESAPLYRNLLGGYDQPGYDLRACRRAVTHQLLKDDEAPVLPQHLLSQAECFATLVYGDAPGPVGRDVSLVASRDGVAHGLTMWFDAELAEGIGFSNAPGSSLDVYGRVVLVWDEPLPLRQGDRVEVSVRAQPLQDEYLWSVVSRHGGRQMRQSVVEAGDWRGIYEEVRKVPG
jgi:protein arginine N-methyltransferase 1